MEKELKRKGQRNGKGKERAIRDAGDFNVWRQQPPEYLINMEHSSKEFANISIQEHRWKYLEEKGSGRYKKLKKKYLIMICTPLHLFRHCFLVFTLTMVIRENKLCFPINERQVF